MRNIFVLKNQHGLFWSRHGEWVNGSEPGRVFRVNNRDEAINDVFEISARDFSQRIEIVEIEANDKGVPVIPADWIVPMPEPEPEVAEELLESTDSSEQAASDDISDSEIDRDAGQSLDFFQTESA